MKQRCRTIVLSGIWLPLLLHADISYLNIFRQQAGLVPFSQESHLSGSAQNHSDYMQSNTIVGHYEESDKTGFTGQAPTDRALYEGYASRVVGENISAGKQDAAQSVDGLLSAIYHRFGFLSTLYDEIGIGTSNQSDTYFYTYDMGNSAISDLCRNTTYNGGAYVTAVCSDTNKKIPAGAWNGAVDRYKAYIPSLILWPPVSGDDIVPVFYEESPDPLPNESVTGYPVSVEFNDGKFSSPPEITHWSITKEGAQTAVQTLILMDDQNDPNGHFSPYQKALFPTKRLEWGSRYNVDLSYRYNNHDYTTHWCFSTRSLTNVADRYYRIENNSDLTLNVTTSGRYAVYVVPKDANDTLGAVQMSWNSQSKTFDYVDHNTFTVMLTGNEGQYLRLSFDNGQKVKFVIAQSDTAAMPSSEVCSIRDHDGDGISDYADWDDDNDGILDVNDQYPLDSSNTVDSDGDGIGDEIDTDDDNDGISDQEEIANRLDPLNPYDAAADVDGDGFDNRTEIIAHTDIRNSNSKPTWVPIISSDGMIAAMVPVSL